MNIWVRAFCRKGVDTATPEALRAGIADRWRPMIFLLSPEADEEPDAALARLRVADRPGDRAGTRSLALLPSEGARSIPLERWTGPAAALEVEEAIDELLGRPAPEVAPVLEALEGVVEVFGLELTPPQARSLALPAAVATALWLAELGAGIVHAEGYGWLRPEGHAALLLLDD